METFSRLSFSKLALSLGLAVALIGATSIAHAAPISKTVLKQAAVDLDHAHRSIGKLISTVDIHAAINVDLSILKGLDAGFRYTYEVQPAYQAGIYTRVDRWSPQLRLRLSNIMTTVDPGAEVIFLRQFNSEIAALKSPPKFDVHQIPLSAENALALSPGDVVMLPVHLNVLLGPETPVNTSVFEIYARGGYVMRGLYQIQALRLADSRVRLRLIATRQEGLEGEVGARLSLKIFGFGIANKMFQGLLGTNLGSIGFGKGPRGLVMADYIFDLSNADARAAYDHLLSSDRLLTNFKLVDPLVSKEELQDMFVADLGGVDQIAVADHALPIGARRIIQIFKGHNNGKTDTFGLNANLFHLFTFRRTTTMSQDNHVVFLDSNNDEQDFLTPAHERNRKLTLGFGIRSEETTRKASIITRADANGQPQKMGEYVVSLEIEDKRMGRRETEDVLKTLKRNIAPSVIADLNIAPLLTATAYKNARVYAQVIFNEKAFQLLEGVSKDTIAEKFNAHLREVRALDVGDSFVGVDSWVRSHRDSVDKIAEQVAASLDPNQPLTKRISTFMDLQRGRFFRKFGTGLIMSLLPQADLKQLLSVYIRLDTTAFPASVEFQCGTSEFRSVVKVVEFIEHQLNKGTFDLRLETFGIVSATSGQVISLKQMSELVPAAN